MALRRFLAILVASWSFLGRSGERPGGSRDAPGTLPRRAGTLLGRSEEARGRSWDTLGAPQGVFLTRFTRQVVLKSIFE